MDLEQTDNYEKTTSGVEVKQLRLSLLTIVLKSLISVMIILSSTAA